MSPSIRIGGMVPLTTTDYPDQLASVLFCQGCPWSCGYCHNPHLIPAQGTNRYLWPEILDFLDRRRKLLDAVVFSGGEPLYQRGLIDAVKEVKQMGFAIGLHTGGAYPDRMIKLLPLLDWVGLDIKTTFDCYEHVTRAPNSGKRASHSLKKLLSSGVAYEVRTTVHSLDFNRSRLIELAYELAGLGVKRYVLQTFRHEGCRMGSYLEASLPHAILSPDLERTISALFEHFEIR